VGSVDLPDQPDEGRRTGRADTRGQDRPTAKPSEMPDPDERGQAYEATRVNVSAETPEQPSPSRQPEGAAQRAYRDEVPRFEEMRAKHEKHWPPAERSTADRSVSRERQAETADAIDRMRKAEPGLSTDAQEIEQDNKERYGGWLEGFTHRLKGEDRLKEKVAEQAAAEPDESAAGVLRRIPDAIRYTYCFEPESYTQGYNDIKERFERRGYEMFFCKNYWTNSEYKGINTRWITPEGQRFEVQFHTPDSFHAKHHVTHDAYERIRNPATSRAELRELHAFQREVFSLIEVPEGAADIPDFKKEGRF
jgi:hypothetical protein